MKLVYPTISQILNIKSGCINTLIVENPSFLYELVKELKNQSDGYDGKWVLSLEDKPIAITKHIVFITDFIDFDVNNKSLVTKIISALEKVSRDEEHIEKSLNLLSLIEQYIYDLSEDYDITIQCEKITIQQILKSAGIKVEIECDKLVETVYSYMQLVREFDGDKLFVFLNFRDFISDDDFEGFSNTVNSHDYKILYIENKAHDRLPNENRLIIDSDLCEI